MMASPKEADQQLDHIRKKRLEYERALRAAPIRERAVRFRELIAACDRVLGKWRPLAGDPPIFQSR
jgi:hypothetical protein